MARSVKTRRIAFEYPPGSMPKHFVDDDLVMSHVIAVLSSTFPNGEDFFVRSVRAYRDDITDPELKEQVGGFIGQEAIHGREHRTLNERLAELGYPTRTIDRGVDIGLKLRERLLPKSSNLALTAALEHYTATLAEVLMTDPEARAMLTVPEVQSMFMWHALEESEHKAVAFDVYQAVSGKHWLRALTMNITTLLFVGGGVLVVLWSMMHDRDFYRPRTLFRSLRRLRHSPWINRRVYRHLRSYQKRDFHPDDRDTTALIEQWRAELFGTEGKLTDRLPASASA